MKTITFILFFALEVTTVFGQANIFPDTFPKTIGFKTVIVKETCLTCPNQKNERISEKFLFNDKGQNIAWFLICDNKPCGEQRYRYNGDNLISYTNRSTWVSTSTTGDFGMVWDSTILSNKLEYLYKNNRLVKTIWTDGQTGAKSLEIEYSYDKEGNLITETITDFPSQNSIGTFKPNSSKLIDDADLKRRVKLKKEYRYTDTTITIKYFKKGNLTGIETKLKNNKGVILKSTLKDSSGKVLKVVTYLYNQDRLKQKEIYETGYDGFGNPYDYLGYDKETYEYDSNGNLTEKKLFSNGQLQLVKKYEYKK